jgi:hypothetical protein
VITGKLVTLDGTVQATGNNECEVRCKLIEHYVDLLIKTYGRADIAAASDKIFTHVIWSD